MAIMRSLVDYKKKKKKKEVSIYFPALLHC